MPDDPHAGRAMRVGGLYVDDIGRVVMPIAAYTGMYGRQMADCVPADDTYRLALEIGVNPSDADTASHIEGMAEWWLMPLAFFADELSEIAESATDREVI